MQEHVQYRNLKLLRYEHIVAKLKKCMQKQRLKSKVYSSFCAASHFIIALFTPAGPMNERLIASGSVMKLIPVATELDNRDVAR